MDHADDDDSSEWLQQLVSTALGEAEQQHETLVACYLAQALDAMRRRSNGVISACGYGSPVEAKGARFSMPRF